MVFLSVVKLHSDGHVEAKEQRKPPRQPHKPYIAGDGRAPDTVDLLAAATPSRSLPTPLTGYAWISPNACFIDSVVELLYRAFLCMTPQARDGLTTHVSQDCVALSAAQGSPHRHIPLARLLWHFMCRSDPSLKGNALVKELQSGQFHFRLAASSPWSLGVNGRHENAREVLPHFIAVCKPRPVSYVQYTEREHHFHRTLGTLNI